MDARKFFSKTGMAFFWMAVVYLGLQTIVSFVFMLAAPELLDVSLIYYIAALGPLYAVAVPVCIWRLRTLPAVNIYKNSLGAGKWINTFFICVFVMYAGNIIGELVTYIINMLTGLQASSTIDSALADENLLVSAVFTVILAPVFEELVFRKFMIDRTIIFGDRTAIVLSGLIFGLFHGNFYQFFYAAGLGMVLAYVYIRTGKLGCCISLHMAVNLVCGIIPTALTAYLGDFYTVVTDFGYGIGYQLVLDNIIPILLLVLYAVCIVVFCILGIIKLIKGRKTIELRTGEYSMPFLKTAGCILSSAGMWLFFAVSALTFALSMM